MFNRWVATSITAGLIILAAAVGLLFAQCGRAPSGSRDGAQVATRRDSIPFGTAYDSLFLRELDSAETRRLFNLQFVPSGLDTERDARPTSYLRYVKPRTLEGHRTAWALPPHPFLAHLMGDVRFYMMGPAGDRYLDFCAVRNGRVYEMPRQFSYLLSDCGWEFTAQDVPDWARALALIDIINRRTLVRWVDVTGAYCPAVPAVSFQSVEVESAGFEAAKAIVRMAVDGTPTETQLPIWIPGWEPGKNIHKSGWRYYPSRSDIDQLSEFHTGEKRGQY